MLMKFSRPTNTRFVAQLALATLIVWEPSLLAASIPMHASFSEIEYDREPCNAIFEKADYDIDFHILNQPRGAVIHFNDDSGFFARANIVANRGYDDLYFEKSMHSDRSPDVVFKLKGDGLYSSDLVILDISAEAFSNENGDPKTPICKVKAQMYATSNPSAINAQGQ